MKLRITVRPSLLEDRLYAHPQMQAYQYRGATPLVIASRLGHRAMLAIGSLSQSEAVDVNHCSAFEYAIRHRHGKIVPLLLQRANVNVPSGPEKWAPLMHACVYDDTDLVKQLLQHEAHLHTVSKGGETALSPSCKSGNKDTFKLLLEADADPSTPGQGGSSLLDLARLWNRPVCGKMLDIRYISQNEEMS